MEDDKVTTKVLDPAEYDEVVTTKDSKMIDAFLYRIIHARMKTAFTSARLNVMTHALHSEEGSLPQGLMIQNTYTKMHNGSKNVIIVVRNSTVYPQTEEDSSGKGGSCQLDARATVVAWNDRCIG